MTRYKTIAELAKQKTLRVAGLMSGTSADGVDVAIVDITSRTQQVVAFGMKPYPAAVRKTVLKLCDPAASNVADICHYNFLLGHIFADALIEQCKKKRHCPKLYRFGWLSWPDHLSQSLRHTFWK